ncbi:hypothetical protein LJB86_05395 [Deltaproteobacteria bacterium OttesenSCG-928-M10]|nr:hypothetical protein [Deltaproteobacteria bacterium OttesenSCG-928-M10]
MRKINNRLFVGALAALLAFAAMAAASPLMAQNYAQHKKVPGMSAGIVPLVTLGDWKDSTPNERYAFLIGFTTMLEAEKYWQNERHGQLLPLKDSLAGSWAKGFEGRTLKNLYDGIEKHIARNPADLGRPLAEVMWFKFVQPRVKEKVPSKR